MKPRVKLTGENGNIFNLLGIASRALKKERMYEQNKEMTDRVLGSGSYDEALQIIMEFCEVE